MSKQQASPLSPGSFVTPPPTNLYGSSSSQETNATEVLSQATNVTEELSDTNVTPPLSPVSSPRGSANATPVVSRLKKTAEPGFRGNPLYLNKTGRYKFRPNLNDPSADYPSNAYGRRVSENSEERYPPRQNVTNTTIANLSLATPISQRNVTARATASNSPAASAASAASAALSLTPKRKRPSQNNQKNEASGGSRNQRKLHKRARTLRKRAHTLRKRAHTLHKQRTPRKLRKQRKQTRRS